MNNKFVAALVIVLALGLVIVGRDSPAAQRWLAPLGLGSAQVSKLQSVVRPTLPSAGAGTLAEAGVHKCRSAGGALAYSDRPCPHGMREVAADGGTISVMSVPKPTPDAAASGSRLVQGFSRAEIDRLRDKEIEDAANR